MQLFAQILLYLKFFFRHEEKYRPFLGKNTTRERGKSMHKLRKAFIFTALSFISTQSIYANYSLSNYSNDPNYQEGEMSYDQNRYGSQKTPDMSGEDAFIIQSRNRFNQMEQTNRNMIQQDQRMMREGSDPNENDYSNYSNGSQIQYDRNNPYRNQEQIMRGNVSYPTDESGYYNRGTENQALKQSNANTSRSSAIRGNGQR